MRLFWARGFTATSMDDLVTHTGASRHSLYRDFGGKEALYLAGFDIYRDTIVLPAFAQVEDDGASLATLFDYLNVRIDSAERLGLPGSGCLIVNATTETAPLSAAVAAHVDAHNALLRAGFAKAIATSAPYLDPEEADELAGTVLTFSNGLWCLSRRVSRADPLRKHVATFRRLLEWRL